MIIKVWISRHFSQSHHVQCGKKVQEKKKKIGVLCFRPRQNVKLGTVQRRLRNVQKGVMHMQSCYIANLKQLVF